MTEVRTEPRVTPAWALLALAVVNVGLAMVVSLTDLAPAFDLSIICVQVALLALVIVLGIRNARIFRRRRHS